MHTNQTRCTIGCFSFKAVMILLLCSMVPTGSSWGANSGGTTAFIAVERDLDRMDVHNAAAWEAAQTLTKATLLFYDGKGGFSDSSGARRSLSDFQVVWHHQGDSVRRSPLHGGAGLQAILAFAREGGAVLLSGGAVGMVDYAGLEPDVLVQRHTLEHHRDPAFMIPVIPSHPVFSGLSIESGRIGISEGGCPAVADFYWGGPANAMVLGNTPAGVERPLVEYALGSGKLIGFGWRWPDYADKNNVYRDNLLRLTENILTYLADRDAWRPVVIPTQFPGFGSDERAGIEAKRWRALQDALEDLIDSFGEDYPHGADYLAELAALEREQTALPAEAEPAAFKEIKDRFQTLQRQALLLDNPLIDFDDLLVIRRRADALGLPTNYHGNTDIAPTGYENTLESLPIKGGSTQVVFRPEEDLFIGDVDLYYDGRKALLSMPDTEGRWDIVEYDFDAAALTALSPIPDADVSNYDACYLPDDRIIFTSTAPYIGVPCVGGRSKVANLYLREVDGQVRRLTNDQDHNWCPTVLNNGRILYLRWEYADIAHAFYRLLFHCGPDGSAQMEYYGSNSFWPASLFYARPIPNHPTKVVAVAGGHHDAPRQGELLILDPALGRHEAEGVVRRIPDDGKEVKPVILDGLVSAIWPRFLHPWPLNEHYFLVSCKPSIDALWGIYLVDVFNNFVLIHEEADWAFLEPVPWREIPRQPVVPDKVDFNGTEARVMLTDVYQGPGLAGVPRGTVKALRLIGYTYTFHELGCEPDRVGLDGPWDVKRIIGTVPVDEDGSAHFTVPAHTPIALQPLDEDGKAVALMRSWLTAMPGETLSCTGCHEAQNTLGDYDGIRQAFQREPSTIRPWYGAARGFSFDREVQPVLDAYCIRCHDGKDFEDGTVNFDLTARSTKKIPSAFQMYFSPSYMALRPWVNAPTLESDAHMLTPRDFHADTSTLVQLLRDDHYGVQLSDEAWDRIITWIDLNAPFHGTWQEVAEAGQNATKIAAAKHGAQRRRELHHRYAGMDVDEEEIPPTAEIAAPEDLADRLHCVPRDFSEDTERALKDTAKETLIERVNLAEGVDLELVFVDAGEFQMGADRGYTNEGPARSVSIEEPFLMGKFEITNEQYRCFDPGHDSGLETGEAYQFGDDERGHTLNRPEQPVVRVSWEQAMRFCEWLTAHTGRSFRLPTEEEWEYTCRAGTTTPLWYGTLDSEFSTSANFSDATHHTVYYPHVPTAIPPWRPADTRFDDTWRVSAAVGSFRPNPWGFHDMHGNVAEWTASSYGSDQAKVVRGGSWRDCPKRGRSAFRNHFDASQCVHDVGFRVVCAP